MEKIFYYKTKIGTVKITVENNTVCGISAVNDFCESDKNSFADKVISQINEYLDGKREKFDFPFKTHGTEFQKKVWAELQKIPYGETKTYGQIAKEIGKPNAARAVGGACNKNPLLLAVPCHRVIGSDGSLTGFAIGTDIKKQLLMLERKNT